MRDGKLEVGDALPSITAISKQFSCARETVVKAYSILKKQGILVSQPGKGFFLASDTPSLLPKVLLMLNNLTPYMEVLYNSFMQSLKGKASVDVFFHHHNIEVFKNIVDSSIGKYHSYIIKPFENEEIDKIFEAFDDSELLILDKRDGINAKRSYIAQDFIEDFYSCLCETSERFKKYNTVYLVFPKLLSHPMYCISAFEKFVNKYSVRSKCIGGIEKNKVEKGGCYIVLNDHELVDLLRICREKKFHIGKDIGIVSYNDTPMKEFIGEGITVYTADFAMMGREAAKFAVENIAIRKDVYARVVLRSSI